MTDRRPSGGFSALIPERDVQDLEASLRFWVVALGFTVAFSRREAAFAYLEREGAQVMLNEINGNWLTGPLTPPFGRGINLQIAVSSVTEILDRLGTTAWPLFRPCHDAWYRVGAEEVGCRQFLVQDPDGSLLRCSESLGTRPLNPGVPGS